MIDDDCDLDALKDAVIDAVRARSAHRAKLRRSHQPIDADAWQQEADRLTEAYREARAAWEECVDERRGPFA